MDFLASKAPKYDSDRININVYIVICVLALILNAVVLFVIRQQKELQNNMRVLYQVLASSDLILGITWSCWDYFCFSPDNSYCSITSLLFPYVYQVSIWFIIISLWNQFQSLSPCHKTTALSHHCHQKTIFHYPHISPCDDHASLWDLPTDSRITIHSNFNKPLLTSRNQRTIRMGVHHSHVVPCCSCLCNWLSRQPSTFDF